MKTVAILTCLTVISAEPVVLRSGRSTHSVTWRSFSASPRMPISGTATDWWSAAQTDYPEENLFVLLRRPKRNAKPKPLLIPLKTLESVENENNGKKHVDDSFEVVNEPVTLTRDSFHLDSSYQSRNSNSEGNQREEAVQNKSHTPHSPELSFQIPTAAMSEYQTKINSTEFSTNISIANSTVNQLRNNKTQIDMNMQVHAEIPSNSSKEAKILIGSFEQVVGSSMIVGKPYNMEGRNLPHELQIRDGGIITASTEADLTFDVSNTILNDSFISLVNETSVDNILAPPSTHSQEEEQSVLRKLVQESILTQLAGNTTQKAEGDPFSENLKEISSNSSSAVLHQLADIKQLLQSHATEKNVVFMSNLDYKYRNFVEKITSALELLKMKLEANTDSAKEKIELISENVSTLKMMIFGQEQRILINDNRVDQFQALLNERMSCMENASAPAALDASKNIFNVTSLDDSFSGVSRIDFNITKLLERAPYIVNNTFEDIYEHIGKLENSIASYDSKLDRYFLKRVEAQEKPDPSHPKMESRCQCNDSKLQAEIDSMKKRITNLTSSLDELKASEKRSVIKRQILEKVENFELLDGSESDMTTAESRVNNITIEGNDNNILASRLRLLETKLAVFETEILSIYDLRHEVAVLKQRLDEIPRTNGSSGGLCVWPYKPHGRQCYHVSTDERQSWAGARSRCKELQGDLAAPPDYDTFRKFIQTQRLSRSYSFWIGASDNKEAGRWMWVNGEPVPGHVWATGHPSLTRSDRCMEVRPDLRLAAAGEACRVSNYFVCQQRGP